MDTRIHTQICFLIDDDEDDREIFGLAMAQVDHSIYCTFAADGIEGLSRLASDHSFVPDHIFIDMNMPRMNGLRCLEEIRKLSHLSEVPVYMYSTSSNDRSISETKALGATGFIVKPSSLADLIGILAGLVQKTVHG